MQKNFFNKDRKNKKMIIAISVSVAIIVIGLAVFCYFLFANEKENNAKNKAENAQEDPQAKIEEEKEEAKVQLPDLKASQYETDEITTGIDVSEFQGNIDWKAVADGLNICRRGSVSVNILHRAFIKMGLKALCFRLEVMACISIWMNSLTESVDMSHLQELVSVLN